MTAPITSARVRELRTQAETVSALSPEPARDRIAKALDLLERVEAGDAGLVEDVAKTIHDTADRSALLARQEAEALRARVAQLEGALEKAKDMANCKATDDLPSLMTRCAGVLLITRQALGGSDGR
jgi:hypothetical protein